jgi:hypothetical protein
VDEGRTDEPQTNQRRLTVAQAAGVLGITEGAVRSRIKRGTLPTIKEGGHVFVVLGGGLGGSTSSANQATNIGEPSDQPELVEALRDQVEHLRRELDNRTEEIRRRDVIISQLTSRIPEIEAPASPEPSNVTEAREVPVTPSASSPRPATTAPQKPPQRPQTSAWPRSLWRRIIGGR